MRCHDVVNYKRCRFTRMESIYQRVCYEVSSTSTNMPYISRIIPSVQAFMLSYTLILQGYLIGSGAIMRLSQCQWSNCEKYGFYPWQISTDPCNHLERNWKYGIIYINSIWQVFLLGRKNNQIIRWCVNSNWAVLFSKSIPLSSYSFISFLTHWGRVIHILSQ